MEGLFKLMTFNFFKPITAGITSFQTYYGRDYIFSDLLQQGLHLFKPITAGIALFKPITAGITSFLWLCMFDLLQKLCSQNLRKGFQLYSKLIRTSLIFIVADIKSNRGSVTLDDILISGLDPTASLSFGKQVLVVSLGAVVSLLTCVNSGWASCDIPSVPQLTFNRLKMDYLNFSVLPQNLNVFRRI